MWTFIEYLIIILVPLIFIGLAFAFIKSQKKIKLQAEMRTGKKAADRTPADYVLMMFGVTIVVVVFLMIAYYFNPGP